MLPLDREAALRRMVQMVATLADVNGIPPNGFDCSYDAVATIPDLMLREVLGQAVWTASDMPHNAADNIRSAYRRGATVGGGIAVNPAHNASWHYNAARALPQDAWDMLSFLWLDLEAPADGIAPGDIDQMLDLLGDRIIYTRRGWWESQPQLRGYDPKAWLWDARWPVDGAPVPVFVPYGPWQTEAQLIAVQTHGGYQIVPGMAVDDDVFALERAMVTKGEFQGLAGLVAAMKARQDALVPAFFDHVTHHPQDATAADVTDLRDRLDALTAQVDAAGAALSGGK